MDDIHGPAPSVKRGGRWRRNAGRAGGHRTFALGVRASKLGPPKPGPPKLDSPKLGPPKLHSPGGKPIGMADAGLGTAVREGVREPATASGLASPSASKASVESHSGFASGMR